MNTYRPHVLVRVWLRLAMPCFVVSVAAGSGIAGYQERGLSAALPYFLAAGLLGALAFAIDARVAWTVRFSDEEVVFDSRWRSVAVRLALLETVDLNPWPVPSMRVTYPDGHKTLPRVKDEAEFLIDLKRAAPSVSVRG